MHQLFRLKAFLKLITTHPLTKNRLLGTLSRFCRLNLQLWWHSDYRPHRFTEKTRLLLKPGMTNALMNLYYGLLEFEDMAFVLHFLRSDDLMVDVGANVGCYTILAAGEVGAQVIACEPVPATYSHLMAQIHANQLQKQVITINSAIGADTGSVAFTSTLDTVNRVATASDLQTIQVPLNSLDELLKPYPTPILLKIDVEGYENEVLKGAKSLLTQPNLCAILIELNGSGNRYKVQDLDLHKQLVAKGFSPYRYEPFSRKFTLLTVPGTHNTLYIRDLSFAQKRVESSKPFKVMNSQF